MHQPCSLKCWTLWVASNAIATDLSLRSSMCPFFKDLKYFNGTLLPGLKAWLTKNWTRATTKSARTAPSRSALYTAHPFIIGCYALLTIRHLHSCHIIGRDSLVTVLAGTTQLQPPRMPTGPSLLYGSHC